MGGMSRPLLSPQLSPQAFEAWYWLKQELQAYCRSRGLPASGSKAVLMHRVQAHLAGMPVALAPARSPGASPAPRAPMPQVLSEATVVAPGWRLNAALRAFFVAHLGPGFRFNQALRDFFRDPQQRTLADALGLWAAAQEAPPSAIERQFQFNQHVRDYFVQHPGATRAQMLQAWRERRQTAQALVFSGLST